MPSCCVVQITEPYQEKFSSILRSIFDQKPRMICCAGVHSESWEEAIDWLCIDLDTSGEIPGAFCVTTSHTDEPLEDVVSFAKSWCELENLPQDVEVIEI